MNASLLSRSAALVLTLGLGGTASLAVAQEPAASAQAAEAAPGDTHIGLIYRPEIAPSSYDAEAAPEDEGVAGARMAVKDNNTTGRFTKQTYALDEVALTEGRSAVDAARDLVGKGDPLSRPGSTGRRGSGGRRRGQGGGRDRVQHRRAR